MVKNQTAEGELLHEYTESKTEKRQEGAYPEPEHTKLPKVTNRDLPTPGNHSNL